jgi:hypothetical protein
MHKENEQKFQATRAEAEKIIKSAKTGATFNVSIRIDLPIEGKPDRIFPDAGASYIGVSKKEALRLVRDLMSETLEAKGARLPIRCYDRESYRPSRGGEPMGKRMVTSYWIG